MAEYAVDDEIAVFFQKTTATRSECEVKARELTTSDRVEPVAIQGCRLSSLALKTGISDLATAVYGSFALSVSLHGQLGTSQEGASNKEPLLAAIAQSSAEFFPFRRNFFTGVASFFVKSWLAPYYRDDLKSTNLRDLWALKLVPLDRRDRLGSMHLHNGWLRFPDYEQLEQLFWLNFAKEVGGMPEQTLTTIKKARVLGFLLSHGFASRLANEATPTPLKDDDHGRYHMMYVDGYLVDPATKMDGVF
ncbi:Aminoglycoside phosphotransferase [Cordyceps fumosorosea ARSEF 2679]|uniref:Aminoglycoside phosphotransferase n=1 Tax=Cordyceps fumosorosea (strain ARSEF 2679) TaxID=1081104 RepID=A0A167CP99_CORFA|nr:Aminoglycoside phosphotransferase [Cordyceps fumosorosea ARSEF 2679]OAA41416.1 Aminoglycoside phosphotransferase [Cordyceps fumosorosea ARSEF 2679]